MAIAAAKVSKLKSKKFTSLLIRLKMLMALELVKTFQNNVRVFVDFAHTPDALSKL